MDGCPCGCVWRGAYLAGLSGSCADGWSMVFLCGGCLVGWCGIFLDGQYGGLQDC